MVEPHAKVAYEALSHIALSYDTPELRELYAELLLKAMDSRTAAMVHPAYFHIVEQLPPEEALLLVGLHSQGEILFEEKATPWSSYSSGQSKSIESQFDSFCTTALSRATDQSRIWLINLCRLGLLILQSSSEAVFRPEEGDRHGVRPADVDNYEHRWLEFTDFGKAFISACAPATEPVTT